MMKLTQGDIQYLSAQSKIDLQAIKDFVRRLTSCNFPFAQVRNLCVEYFC